MIKTPFEAHPYFYLNNTRGGLGHARLCLNETSPNQKARIMSHLSYHPSLPIYERENNFPVGPSVLRSRPLDTE